MLKKQRNFIIIISVIFAGLLGLYLLVINPMLNKAADIEGGIKQLLESEPFEISNAEVKKLANSESVALADGKSLVYAGGSLITLLDGETLGTTNRIMITPKVDKSEVKNVVVKNKVDEYKVVHHIGQSYYFVETAEFAYPDQELISQFFTNTGYLLSMMRVAAKDIDDGNEILADLESFGFNKDNSYFIVTKTDDSWYKIIIGDKIPTTGGYYVMYEDKNGLREAVYILDTMMESTILSNRYSLLSPIVCRPINTVTDTMYIDNFQFYKGQDLIVDIYNAEIPEESNRLVNRQMRYPAPYAVSDDNYSEMLSTLLTNLLGERVVHAFGIENEEYNAEILDKYGFTDYSCKMTFNYNEIEYYLLFSELNKNGNYYVFSIDFNTIVEIAADKVPFVEWDLLRFIDRAIFMENINDVSEIVVKSPGQPDIQFTLEGIGQELIVKGGELGGVLNVLETQNFRQFYIVMLSMDMWEYEEDTSSNDPMCELIINMRNGSVYEFGFYFVPTNTRRCFFTLNGSGQFYVMRDRVLKLINDTALVLNNEPINAAALE